MYHPYADLIGLKVIEQQDGYSVCSVEVVEKLRNPHNVVHGAILYSLADTGMGLALYPSLKEQELCATIEIKINYYKPVRSGNIVCTTDMINRGKSIANLESAIYVDNMIVAKANGNFSIFTPSNIKVDALTRITGQAP